MSKYDRIGLSMTTERATTKFSGPSNPMLSPDRWVKGSQAIRFQGTTKPVVDSPATRREPVTAGDA